MGYKSTGIFIDQETGPYFGTSPNLEQEGVSKLLNVLKYKAQSAETVDFQLGSWTRDSDIAFVGSYANGAFFSERALAEIGGADKPSTDEINAVMKPFIQLYPNGKSLFWYINDTVNAYAYAYYEGDTMLRAFAGSINEEISLDYGVLQPEDHLFFSEDESGRRLINIDDEDETLSSVAGDIVLEFTKRFLGERIDNFNGALSIQKIKLESI